MAVPQIPAARRREILLAAGPVLFGRDWQRAMARGLGPHHPRGARESIDDRLVRRWVAGDVDVPEWVPMALGYVAVTEAQVYSARLAELRAFVRRWKRIAG